MFSTLVFGMQLGDVILATVAIVLSVAFVFASRKRSDEELRDMFVGGEDGRR